MEPVDYLGALRRSWRLIVALGLIGVLIAVLVPVGGAPRQETCQEAPQPLVSPGHGRCRSHRHQQPGGRGSHRLADPILRQQHGRQRDTVNASGLRTVKTANLGSYLKATLLVPSGAGKREAEDANEVELNAKGKTAHQARTLANDYANEVGIYLNRIASARVRATSAGRRSCRVGLRRRAPRPDGEGVVPEAGRARVRSRAGNCEP